MIRRLFAGLGLSAAGLVVVTLGQIAAVPIYLAHWGAQVYGEWLALTGLASSASLLHLGVQTYAGNLLIRAYARGEIEAGSRVLHAALRLYLVLCGLALLVLAGVVLWPGLPARLNIESLSGAHARAIVLAYGLIYVYGLLGGLLMSLFRATNQMPRQLAYGLVESLVLLFAPASVALAGGRPAAAALLTGLLFAVVSLVEYRDIRRRSPFALGWSQGSWRAAFSLLAPSMTFFLVSVAALLLSAGMTVTISVVVGAAAVAVYATTLMLTNFVRTIVNRGLNVLWPEITAAAAQPETGRLLRWHRLALKLAGLCLLAAAAGIGLLGRQALSAWTGGEIQIDRMLNWLFVAYLLAHGPALVSGVFGLALNRQSQLLRAHLLTAALSVGLAWALLPRLGVAGAALALAVGQAAGSAWILRMACAWTADTLPALLGDVGARSLPLAAFALLGALLLDAVLIGSWGRVLAAGSLVLLALALGWWTWFRGPERALLAGLIPGRLGRWVRSPQAQEISA